MAVFRKTAVVQFELPSTPVHESLPLTRERAFGVFLSFDGQLRPAQAFRSPINDEQWREFNRDLRLCNTEGSFHGAEAIRALGRDLYEALAAVSPELRAFLAETGTPRRLVLQTQRPELHVLPWGALFHPEGRLLAADDLSIVQCWEPFSTVAVGSPATLNLVTVFGADTNKTTAAALKTLPAEITRDPAGTVDILHLEEHGNAVLGSLGRSAAPAVAGRFACARLALLWSCYSSSANSWGECPALCLHRVGAGLVLSFQAELHVRDARSLAEGFYADVFGPAASRDPETALVRLRAQKFAAAFEQACWASMVVYLRAPVDLSALPLNGPRVPARAWTDASVDAGWMPVQAAVDSLIPGSVVAVPTPANLTGLPVLPRLPQALCASWRGNVIHLHGTDDPLRDEVLDQLFVPRRNPRHGTAADRLLWFFERIASFGAPLVLWTGVTPWQGEFLRIARPGPNLTFLLLLAPDSPPGIARLVDLNMLNEARAAYEAAPADLSTEDLHAAYLAFARAELPARAAAIVSRVHDPVEQQLLRGNFLTRFCRLPEDLDTEEAPAPEQVRQGQEEACYRGAHAAAEAAEDTYGRGRARHELAYFQHRLGRYAVAESLYRAALADFERAERKPAERGRGNPHNHASLIRLLRDLADLLAEAGGRCTVVQAGIASTRHAEAAALLARAEALAAFYGRSLELAYIANTSAHLALQTGSRTEAIHHAMDAANRFEHYANWRGWAEALSLLLEALALGEGSSPQTLATIRLAEDKLATSNLPPAKRRDLDITLCANRARAHWQAGDLKAARAAVHELPEELPASLAAQPLGTEVVRLRQFLLSPRRDADGQAV